MDDPVDVYLCIGRGHCPACGTVWTVVYHPEADVRCPTCEQPVNLKASGDERLRHVPAR